MKKKLRLRVTEECEEIIVLYEEYQLMYRHDHSDKYHHLPPIDVAKKISKTLHQRFSVSDLTQGLKYRIADKYEIIDTSMHKLTDLLEDDGIYKKLMGRSNNGIKLFNN
ncbi:hypothetical protein [Leuconostoc citreum]